MNNRGDQEPDIKLQDVTEKKPNLYWEATKSVIAIAIIVFVALAGFQSCSSMGTLSSMPTEYTFCVNVSNVSCAREWCTYTTSVANSVDSTKKLQYHDLWLECRLSSLT